MFEAIEAFRGGLQDWLLASWPILLLCGGGGVVWFVFSDGDGDSGDSGGDGGGGDGGGGGGD